MITSAKYPGRAHPTQYHEFGTYAGLESGDVA